MLAWFDDKSEETSSWNYRRCEKLISGFVEGFEGSVKSKVRETVGEGCICVDKLLAEMEVLII